MADSADPVLDLDTQRRVAGALFNRVWDLLDAGDARTAEQTTEMIDAAHTSRYHWGQVGGAEQSIVAEWQVSRAYASAGIGAEAVRHAELSYQLLQSANDLPDWLAASVHEGRARAYLAAGDRESALTAYASSKELLPTFADDEDRDLIGSQLAELGL